MIDLHSHILYGVDDGATTLQESIDMIKQASLLGITEICATSHYKSGKCENKNYNENYEKLFVEVEKQGIPVKIHTGNELMLDIGGLGALKDGKINTMNNTDYILVEPVPGMNGAALERGLQKIIDLGYLPILAHVERYTHINLDMLVKIRNLGVVYQVNIKSISDTHRTRVHELVKKKLIDIVATDSHRIDKRNYDLSSEIESWKELVGDGSWEWLSTRRPQMIICGKRELENNDEEKIENSLTGIISGISRLWKRNRSR